MTFPVVNGRITQGFSKTHPGIDIAPPVPGQQGVPCLAPQSGVVTVAGYKPSLEGNYIIMRADDGWYWYFGHFATKKVSQGQRVNEGQAIGILGKTGAATGIHTHCERRRTQSGGSVDPLPLFKQGDNMAEPSDYRVNPGDVINGFSVFGRTPSQADKDAWVGQTHKKFWYEKIADGVAKMPASQKKPDDLLIRLAYNIGLFRQPSDEEIAHWRDFNTEQMLRAILESDEHNKIGKPIDDSAKKLQEIDKIIHS